MAHNAFGSSFSSFALEPAQAAEKVRRHPKYYLNGGDVHFLVENYIFRVHRYFFERESQAFREWLGVPPAPGQQPRGSSDANPYPLDDTREEDFSRFLWVFYNPKYSIYDANDHEWISILKLSHSWDFPEVKRLSIRNIEGFELEPVRKIELYQIYEVDRRLLIPSYVALVNRPQPLTLQEGRRLGLDTALMLATARECARGKKESGKHSPTASSLPADVMAEIVRDVFALKQRTPASPALGPIADGAGPAAFAVTPLSPSRIVTKALPKQDPMSPSPAPISLPPTQHAHKASEPSVKSPTKTKIEIPPYPLAQSISQTANTPSAPKVGDVPEYLANNFATPPSNANANGSAKPSGGSKDSTRPASPTKPASKEKEEDKKEAKKDTKDKDVKASAAPATPSQAQAPTHNASKSGQSSVREPLLKTTSNPPPQSSKTPRLQQPPPTPNPQKPSSPTQTRKMDPVPEPPRTKAPSPVNSTSGPPESKGGIGAMLPVVGRSLESEIGLRKNETPSPGFDTDNTSTANNAGIVGHEFHDLATNKHESVARDAKVENTSGDSGKPAHAGEKSEEVKESAPPLAPPLRDAPAPAEDIKPAAVSVPELVPATQESVAEKESASHEAPPADVQDTSAAVAADGQGTAEQNGLTDTSTTDPSAGAAETSAEPAKPTQEPSASAVQLDTTTAAAADLFSRVPTEPGDVEPWDFDTDPVDVNPAPPADPQENLLADAVLVQTSDAVAAPADPVSAATASVKPTTTLSVKTSVPPVRQLRDSSVQTAIDESSSFVHGERILAPRSANPQHAATQSQAANPIVRTLSTGKDAGVQSAVEPGDDAKRFAETVAKSAPAESDNSNTTEKKKKTEGVKADAETTVDGTATSGVPESTAKDEAKTDASAQLAATAAQPEGQAQDDGKAAKPTLHVDTGNAADEPPAVPPKEEPAAAAVGTEAEAEAASSIPKHMQDADDASTEGGDGTSRSASPQSSRHQKKKRGKKGGK